ncbi:hypothetical protein CONCODRAFT_3137, partial [Conidiobolus coronatus NRRL 28638]
VANTEYRFNRRAFADDYDNFVEDSQDTYPEKIELEASVEDLIFDKFGLEEGINYKVDNIYSSEDELGHEEDQENIGLVANNDGDTYVISNITNEYDSITTTKQYIKRGGEKIEKTWSFELELDFGNSDKLASVESKFTRRAFVQDDENFAEEEWNNIQESSDLDIGIQYILDEYDLEEEIDYRITSSHSSDIRVTYIYMTRLNDGLEAWYYRICALDDINY